VRHGCGVVVAHGVVSAGGAGWTGASVDGPCAGAH